MIGSDMRARIVPCEVQSISDRVGVCKKRKCKRQATQDTKPDVCQTTGRMATLIYCCAIWQVRIDIQFEPNEHAAYN